MIRDFLTTDDEPTGAALLPDAPAAEAAAKAGLPPLNVTDTLPVGMMYASMQTFTDRYTPEEALCRGTLFQALDLPFRGGERK